MAAFGVDIQLLVVIPYPQHTLRPGLVLSGNQWAVDRLQHRAAIEEDGGHSYHHQPGASPDTERARKGLLKRAFHHPDCGHSRGRVQRLSRAPEPGPQDLSRCQSRKAPIPTLGQMPAYVRSQPKSRTLQSWFSAGDKSTPSWSARSVLDLSSSAFSHCWCYCCSLPTTPTRVLPWLSIVVMLLV